MISTLSKKDDYCESGFLTPIRFLESTNKVPKQSINTDSNIAVFRARLELIIKTTQDNFSKWLAAEKRGLALCNTIEAIKTGTILTAINKNDKADSTLYPKDLIDRCRKLSLVVGVFQEVVINAKNSVKQIESLRKLPGSNNEIFYRSWRLDHFADFLMDLSQRYDKEYKIKKHALENLPHCFSQADLIRCVSAWEYPQYVDSFLYLKFLFLNEELNIKKK
uniref:Uncharacterized protein n=1 Tax=Glossina austeni TaxID=7395 RepID=A0A1A9UNS0_GLOAU